MEAQNPYPFSLKPSSSKMTWTSNGKQMEEKYEEGLPIKPTTPYMKQSFMDFTSSWAVNHSYDNGDFTAVVNPFGSGNGYRSNDPLMRWMDRSNEPDDLMTIVKSCSYYSSAGSKEENGVAGMEGRGSSSGGGSILTSVVIGKDDEGSSMASDAGRQQLVEVGKEVMGHTWRREEDAMAYDSRDELVKRARRSENNGSISAVEQHQQVQLRNTEENLQLQANVNKIETQKFMLPPKPVSWDGQRLSLNLENKFLRQKLSSMSEEKRHNEAQFGLLSKEREMLQTSFALQQQQQQKKILKLQQKKQKQLQLENKLKAQRQQLEELKLHKLKQSQGEEQRRRIRQQLQVQLQRDLQQLLETQLLKEEQQQEQQQQPNQQQLLQQEQKNEQELLMSKDFLPEMNLEQQQQQTNQQQFLQQEQTNEQELLMNDFLPEMNLEQQQQQTNQQQLLQQEQKNELELLMKDFLPEMNLERQQQQPNQQQILQQEQQNEQEPLMKDFLPEMHLDFDIDLDFFNSFS